ncbi:MAG TPA: glycosyltransferase [Solirubrobacterales bacterium]|nr:glycosyltransferase [Solirubrobacterales bacterium]
MRVCLIAPAPNEAGAPAHSPRALAALLSQRHEVTLIHSGWGEERPQLAPSAGIREAYADLPEGLQRLKFACEDHRHSAAVMEAIRSLYPDGGPDYIEAPDFRAHGLVPLQARRGGDPLLAATTIAVRSSPSAELISLQDGAFHLNAHTRLAELEREQLRLADRLLWSGGDGLDLYRRYYGEEALPPGVRIRPAFELPGGEGATAGARSDEPLRLLYCGDLRRSAGVVDLVEACWALPPESWRLTVAGEDTTTAGMDQSVRETIEVFSGEDRRIEFAPAPDAAALRELLTATDLLVVPARLEATAGAALAALGAGTPVLATPVGDLVEVVEDGVSGWHAEDIGPVALGRALRRLEADRGELNRVRDSGAPAERARQLTDPAPILAAYDELLGSRAHPAPLRPAAAGGPLVTGIVPYFRAHKYVREAVASLLAQTYPEVEVLVVNDGSFAPDDAVLAEFDEAPRVTVVTKPNSGEGPARTLGARLARGEYVVMLDSDNLLEPTFVERSLAVLMAEPDLAYVTCWLRMVGPDNEDTDAHPSFAPLGNSVLGDYSENWDGDTLAMLPRRVFTDLGFEFHREGSMHSDWELYRWLRSRGRFGAVIPERLGRYRVLPDSLMRGYSEELQRWSWSESESRIGLHAVRWTAGAPG